MKKLDGSFTDYIKTAQAGNWNGKVTKQCAKSPFMNTWTKKLVLSNTLDDIKFYKWFWAGALQLNMSIGRGRGSKFTKFIGTKLLGIAKKAGLKIKVKGKKTGLKIKVKGKKSSAKKSSAKKSGAKKSSAKKSSAKKSSAKKSTAKKSTAKKSTAKKSTAKTSDAKKSTAKKADTGKSAAKKVRRLQQTTSGNAVNLDSTRFVANVPQPTALAGDGQSTPAKSWMMVAGLMTFVALLFA